MKWLKRKINLKPSLIVGLIVALAVVGGGVAYAVTTYDLPQNAEIWPGQAQITNATDLEVIPGNPVTKPIEWKGYQLVFDITAQPDTKVIAVEVLVHNKGAAPHQGWVKVRLLDNAGALIANGEAYAQTGSIAANGYEEVTVSINAGAGVSASSVDNMQIILTQTS